MDLPEGRYKVYKTKKYTIYYVLDDVEIRGNYDRKLERGGHEFYFAGDVVVVKPLRETSQAQEAL
ncbi:hypothetical protein [Pyrobaculum neutrophilum]|uniref:Uncharacterized protein n=1 Tax=Pyrobaculum neutrophilum (strain DSM 2338 / JCM 9278 / NBRC 100436 / V24Sta) TaxID=444157 RepID=B1Y9L8_PYRNV|nr:hypothetical protein [Pyrobaculum neutrophilum]ACB40447.1 conserved hypothetical protein [Pyrobaculum neutrophilum V24Sta]